MTLTWLGIGMVIILALFGWFGYRRGFIREVMSMFFVVLSIALVWIMNPYINDFLRDNTPLYETVQDSTKSFVETQMGGRTSIGQQEQSSLIKDLGLPAFLAEGLEENNNAAVYEYLAVSTFTDYVSDYIAVAVVNGLSFLVSFLLATLLIRMITYALDIIARLPIIKGVNKLAGGFVGALKGLLFIWIGLLLLTVFCNTDIGRQGLGLIEKDYIANFLYENDIFVKIFMSIFYGTA